MGVFRSATSTRMRNQCQSIYCTLPDIPNFTAEPAASLSVVIACRPS